ncbi:MAG: RNA-binding protein [Streptosporangiales bacterium]|nr:RNA-binding protein [Streptosporangiales bacterium]
MTAQHAPGPPPTPGSDTPHPDGTPPPGDTATPPGNAPDAPGADTPRGGGADTPRGVGAAAQGGVGADTPGEQGADTPRGGGADTPREQGAGTPGGGGSGTPGGGGVGVPREEGAGTPGEGDGGVSPSSATPLAGDAPPEPVPSSAINPAPLPDPVRVKVLELAAETLGRLPGTEVPAPLRRVARFEPRRRARLGAPQIAAHLEADPEFREKVAELVRSRWPDLAAGVAAGAAPPAADPVLVAAAAYLLRPGDWAAEAERVRAELERTAAAEESAAAQRTASRLRHELASLKEDARGETERLRGELKTARGEIADLRRRLHEARQRTKEVESRAEAAATEAGRLREAAAHAQSTADTEARRLRGRLAAAEAQLEDAKRATREGRSLADARLRMLLDVLSDAAAGLRRELSLPATIDRPGDVAVGTAVPASGAAGLLAGVPDDDPGLLDRLLQVPRLHMIVDGYNVTKTGYPTLPLADQRRRLLGGLGGIAARTGVEITCVFDGAEVEAPLSLPAPRGVRVAFSSPGETADEVIVRMVRAEPPGRPVAVVTSDREIITEVRRAGARPVPSAALLRRLERA